MHTPSAKGCLSVAVALLLAVAVGCEKNPPPNTSIPISGAQAQGVRTIADPLPSLPNQPKGDNRSYWTYDGGHFAQGVGEAWFEHTPEAEKARGKPWEFREVSRSKEHVELYDAGRAVTVRLTDAEVQARWDKDGKDAEWKTLQKGKWGRPE